MKQRLTILASLAMLLLIAACQPGLQPTQFAIVVTREVTVVVTSQQNGPVPVATEASDTTATEAEATPEAQTAADANATAVPTEATIVENTTPTITPTVDPFPTPERGQIFVADQQFQNGRMFWLQPINQIWVLLTIEGGEQEWQIYEDTFEEGMLESDPTLQPPATGLIQPIRGFGLLWRENDALRENLGWAIDEEVGYLAAYQYTYGGTLDDNNEYVAGPGFHLLETLDQTALRFNEGIWTWEIFNPEAEAEETSSPSS